MYNPSGVGDNVGPGNRFYWNIINRNDCDNLDNRIHRRMPVHVGGSKMMDLSMLVPILAPFTVGTVVMIFYLKLKGDDIVKQVH